jgi:arabinofuranosyltransferase
MLARLRSIPPSLALAAVPLLVLGVQGWARRWTSDDGFIYLRVVENLVAGDGPVLNVGERVEAYTSPLWLALVACVSELLGFVDREWVAVGLGIAASLAGLALAMRGARLLWAASGRAGLALPLGALAVAALPPYWDFATSGLETGVSVGWLGAAFWALVRALPPFELTRRRLVVAALVLGIGPLVRPDLAVFAGAFLLVLLVAHRPASWRTRLAIVGVAAALPLAYEVFRLGYFASLVPSPAIAKEATYGFWDHGWPYLEDFVTPYWLWLPVAALLAYAVAALRRGAPRPVVLAAAAPVVAGLVHALYVVRVGGDFMHARLLLPSLFGILLPVAVIAPSRRAAAVLAVAVVPWAVLCAATLRPDYAGTQRTNGDISDERGFYADRTGTPNPVTIGDYAPNATSIDGQNARLASERGRVLIFDNPHSGLGDPKLGRMPLRADVELPVVTHTEILGQFSYAAGRRVWVVDRLGLGDAIAARIIGPRQRLPNGELVTTRRIGHEKLLRIEWVVARFAPRSYDRRLPPRVLPGVRAARAALRCGDLRRLMVAVAAPLTFDRFVSNIGFGLTHRGFRLHNDPVIAERALCR